MKRILLAAAFLAGFAGCQCMRRQVVECCGGVLPGSCPAEPARPARCPSPRIDVQEPEEVVVRAPRQKVVVEAPGPCQAQAPAAAPCQAPAPAAPCQAPAVMPASYPQQAVPQMTTTVKQKTRMGLMFETIRIPFPILRPVAIPQPAEVTTTMPVTAAPTMMAPMMGMPMAAPMMPMTAAPMMPMAAGMPMGMPMAGAMGMGMAAPTMGMVAQPVMGGGQMTVQAQMSLQQALMMLAAQGQLPPQFQSLLGAGGTVSPSLAMQLLAQLNLSPAQMAALRAILSGTTPAGGTAPTTGGVSTAVPTTAAPAAGSPRTPVVSLDVAGAAPAPTAAALQDQLRAAEQRLKELEDARRGSAK